MDIVENKIIEFNKFKLNRTNDEFLFCLTLYNENHKKIIDSIKSISNAISKLNTKNCTICIIADGLDMINETTLSFFTSLGITKINKRADLHVFKSKYLNVNLLIGIKEKNKGKLDSHWWFYQLFCKKIQPKYCIQIDAGVKMDENSLFIIKEYMDYHNDVGAAAIRLELPELKKDSNIFRIWHYNDFEIEKNVEWAAEELSGFLTVLPGQCSVVRWKALNMKILYNYFIGLKSNNPYEINRFRSEDRVLGCEIATQSKSPKIKFIPEAKAVSDEFDDLPELLKQRRRWVNGHFTVNVWSIPKFIKNLDNDNFEIGYKLHLLLSTFWTIINALVLWIFPALMIILTNVFWNDLIHPSSLIIQMVFGFLIISQILVSIFIKSEKKIINFFNVSGFWQIIILGLGCIISTNDWKLIIIVLYFLEILNTIFSFKLNTKRNLFEIITSVIQYSIVRPVFKLILGIYGFTNVHDNSWGTKNLNAVNNNLIEKNKLYRHKFLTYWLLSNIILIGLYLFSNNFVLMFIIVLISLYVIFRIISSIQFIFKHRG